MTTRAVHPHLWRIALLWALLLAAYSSSFKAGLIFDNDLAILRDDRLHAATTENVERIFSEGFWLHQPDSGLYRPVTSLSFLLNYAVLGNGPNPAGYHVVNLILHALNAALVYALGLLLLKETRYAFPMAAIWALHPVFTESVTNIIQRADLFAAFFVLAGLFCHIQASAAAGMKRRRAIALTGLFVCQTLGLFSKESAAVLPALMLAYDLTWLDRARWRTRAASYATLILPFVAFFYLRHAVQTNLEVLLTDNPLFGTDFVTARLTAIKVIGKLLWLLVWPAKLSVDYSFNAIPVFGWSLMNWEDIQTVLALALCLGCIPLAIRWHRTRKPLFFLMAFAIIAFAPTSNLVIFIGSIMAERWAYLPAVGLAGCAVAGVHALSRRVIRNEATAPRAAGLALALAVVAFGARTYARNFDWYDNESLWRSAVAAQPDNAKARLNLGNALAAAGDLPGALAQYQAALTIDPDYAYAYSNLGSTLMRMPGRTLEAVRALETAVRLDPSYVDAHVNLGTALSNLEGRQEEAIAHFREALRLFPNSISAHSNLGGLLLQYPDRLQEAVAEFEAALRVDPQFTDARFGLASALARLPGQQQRAVAEFETVLREKSNDAGARHNLGTVLSQLGRREEAMAQWRMAIEIDPRLAQSRYSLGLALAETPGQETEAIRELEIAHRLTGDPRILQLVDQLKGNSPSDR